VDQVGDETSAFIKHEIPERIGHNGDDRKSSPIIADDAAGHAPGTGRPRATAQMRMLHHLGIGKPQVQRAALAARSRNTSLRDELISSGLIAENIYFEAVAEMLGVAFVKSIDPARVIATPNIDALLKSPWQMLRIDEGSGRTLTILAPRARELEHLDHYLSMYPGLCQSFAIATPATIRTAVWQARAMERAREVTRSLFEQRQAMSARIVATAGQGFAAGIFVTCLVIAFVMYRSEAELGVHFALTMLFLACTMLRLLAGGKWRPVACRKTIGPEHRELPTYSIVVPLYDEAAVVGQLVEALDALKWPRSKLDIKLVCEDDDLATIEAISNLALRPEYEVVRVPRMQPYTKPKALCYAMAGVRGEFVVVYDAEDRPDPEQLLEAYSRFRVVGPKLACIQAPLVIANARINWLTGLFALEYCGLFRCMLPFLARARLPLPLGGTSNHIRTDVLHRIGLWDPYNVTEDADLGLRLARHGYEVDVITRPTFEDAPTNYRVWIAQRSRWFKGWLQTWLVIMRQPVRLYRECGPHGFLAFQIMTVGMLVSALANPLMIWFVLSSIASWLSLMETHRTTVGEALAVIDVFNLFATYTVFIFLGYRAMTLKEKMQIGWRWLYLPVYWLLMSVAAWRAVIMLIREPFAWDKTPHEPALVTNARLGMSASSSQAETHPVTGA
jgi:glycosyltransferase XagB